MAKRQTGKFQQSTNNDSVDLQNLYTEARRQFTAADLQKYTVTEKGIPLAQVIAEMEGIQKHWSSKRS
jgi:hypothetical protein